MLKSTPETKLFPSCSSSYDMRQRKRLLLSLVVHVLFILDTVCDIKLRFVDYNVALSPGIIVIREASASTRLSARVGAAVIRRWCVERGGKDGRMSSSNALISLRCVHLIQLHHSFVALDDACRAKMSSFICWTLEGSEWSFALIQLGGSDNKAGGSGGEETCNRLETTAMHKTSSKLDFVSFKRAVRDSLWPELAFNFNGISQRRTFPPLKIHYLNSELGVRPNEGASAAFIPLELELGHRRRKA